MEDRVEYTRKMMLSALKNLYKMDEKSLGRMEKRIDSLIAAVREQEYNKRMEEEAEEE